MADLQLVKKPIIIVGAPRSGTTFLGQLLSNHEDLAFADEPRLTWRYGNDGRSDLLRPEHARPNVIEHIHESFANFVSEHGGKRLLEKTPSNALRVPFVDQVFPDATYIHIIRHGLDSVLSIQGFWQRYSDGVRDIVPGRVSARWKEVSLMRIPYYWREVVRRFAPKPLRGLAGPNVWGPRLPGIQTMMKELDLLEICCLQWRMCVELTAQFGRTLPSDRYMECRLEDMSKDQIKQIIDFCDLPDSPAVWSYFDENFRQQKTGKHGSSTSDETVKHIRQWIDPTLQWLGYD